MDILLGPQAVHYSGVQLYYKNESLWDEIYTSHPWEKTKEQKQWRSEYHVIYTAEKTSPAVPISILSGFEKVKAEVHSDDATLVGEMQSPMHITPSLDDRQNYFGKAGMIWEKCTFWKRKT